MDNQKIENLLDISLATPQSLREHSPNLESGYDAAARTWELILLYSTTEEILTNTLRSFPDTTVIPLLNNYAIVRTPQNTIGTIAALPFIDYVEKPKPLYFQLQASKQASCITAAASPSAYGLSGKGVIVGIIDTGIDYDDPVFQDSNGNSRFISIWDQSVQAGTPPQRYGFGAEYSAQELADGVIEVTDLSGHGSAVCRIAAGRNGVAPESSIIFVKMGIAGQTDFPRTTQLITAIDYILRKAADLQQPVAINISFGNNYGSHNGSSLLESYINAAGNTGKASICIGCGNEGNSATHTSLTVGNAPVNIPFTIAPFEKNVNVQMWKYYWDDFEYVLITPSGSVINAPSQQNQVFTTVYRDTTIQLYTGAPSPFNIMQEIYIEFFPNNSYIESGIWTIELRPIQIKSGTVNLWLPAQSSINSGTQFLNPTPELTQTIPSTAAGAISVAAYDARFNAYAAFSGQGGLFKPDLSAPGVDIRIGSSLYTGTSFATPFVTGSAAMLMEWGIIRQNDPYLYGEKLKSYLIRGARPIDAFSPIPNSRTGYGALCLSDSIPI